MLLNFYTAWGQGSREDTSLEPSAFTVSCGVLGCCSERAWSPPVVGRAGRGCALGVAGMVLPVCSGGLTKAPDGTEDQGRLGQRASMSPYGPVTSPLSLLTGLWREWSFSWQN